jgi:hypothetical protein
LNTIQKSESEKSGLLVSRASPFAQLMNHFIESPEIVMFEGSEVG